MYYQCNGDCRTNLSVASLLEFVSFTAVHRFAIIYFESCSRTKRKFISFCIALMIIISVSAMVKDL